MLRLIAVLALAACSTSPPAPAQTTAPATPVQTADPPAPPAPSPAPAPSPGPTLGAKCGDKDSCPPGQTCVTYYGIAGARGPQFKSCEIPCKDDSACPKDRHCKTIADGPGQVCR